MLDNKISAYLSKINSIYSPGNEKKTFKDIIDSYKEVSSGYSDFLNKEIKPFSYSSYNFSECSREEQKEFYEDQLQLIECLVTDSIYSKTGIPYDWGSIFKLLYTDKRYALTEKSKRKVVYSTSGTVRPVGDNAYNIWNGLQIIDIDIKDEELSSKLKPIIFKELCNNNWFLGVCKSSSKKSLHVWTKITPLSVKYENKKIEYLCNFRQKYSVIYIILLKHAAELGYTKEKIFDFMDMAMSKPQQGIFITSDPEAMLNMNFQDLRLDINFEKAFDEGMSAINWISHPDLKPVFSKLEWFTDENLDKSKNIELEDITQIESRDTHNSKGPRHYKHQQRWQLANTLNKLFGPEKAFEIMIDICKDTPARELKADVKTASIHNKPISRWALQELNSQHGFSIKYNDKEDDLESTVINDVQITEDPIRILNSKVKTTELHISSKQYLSDIKDQIIDNLGHMTLLEAGAGLGKTEMIKSMNAKILLILPFTSTIKSKIECSEVTKDWLYFYGKNSPTLEDLFSDKSMSMTIDKFAKLNLIELNQAGFKYIVIDESHLLFISSYRDVMSPCIQRLANCKPKVIMMTGTPTAEILFFPNLKHIKIVKDDTRIKDLDIHFCYSKTEQLVEMTKSMADDILNGKKILYPTNNGNMYYNEITGLLAEFLEEKGFSRKLNSFYYKKSNYGDTSMNDININKTIGDNDIIFCTNYLSVGVDILDRKDFTVYFNDLWIPQEVEQFANRLRNNNLFIKMFLPLHDESGFPYNYNKVNPLNLLIPKEELLVARDMVKTCNDIIERNNEESKYNPLIASLLTANKYLKYDENERKYFIDETTYKLKVFEERYRDFSKQLKIMIQGMQYYGFKINEIFHKERITDENKESLAVFIKGCRKQHFNYITEQTMAFLKHINDNNIDIYADIMRGSYEIFKNDAYKEERENNNLYVEDIEILERNIPIVLSLYKFYDCDTIQDIYKYCTEEKSKRINFAKLERIKRFVIIESNRKKHRIDFPILQFMKDTKAFVKKNPELSKQEITNWQVEYAVKYANTVKDVVVEDKLYLEKIFDIIRDLWKILVIEQRPVKGKVKIKPFELLWETKKSLMDIYGNEETKEFFGQELISNIKDTEEDKADYEFTVTEKKHLSEVEAELKDIIHNNFNYAEYSVEDKSNERFLNKQQKEYLPVIPKAADNDNDSSYMEEQAERKETTLFSSST